MDGEAALSVSLAAAGTLPVSSSHEDVLDPDSSSSVSVGLCSGLLFCKQNKQYTQEFVHKQEGVMFATNLVVLVHEGIEPQLFLVLLEKGFALIVRLGGATLGGAHHRGHLYPLGAVLLDGVANNLHFFVSPVVVVHAVGLDVEPPQDPAVAAGTAAHHPRRDFCQRHKQKCSQFCDDFQF